MYFDLRLWEFTRGVRLRIAWAVTVGLLAAGIGVARLALLGWLLAKVFRGESLQALVVPFAAVAAVMVLRGVLEYARNRIAHRTAARVQLHIRRLLYDKVVALGPAHFGQERTGEVILSLVDGVEQLETYFGQYLPQVFVAALTPLFIFAFVAILDLPVAAMLTAFALITLISPAAFHRWDSRNSRRRQKAYGEFGAEFLDSIQGLATLKAFGQSTARARSLAEKAHELFRSTMWVLGTNTLARGITDAGIAVGTAATLALGAYRVSSGAMSLEALLVILMMGIEVFRPLRELRALLHQGMVGLSAAMGIFKILDARPLVVDTAAAAASAAASGHHAGDSPRAPLPLPPTIEFENVHFSYPGGRRAAHRGLSFRVAAGERVGIVGASGAGKSTIVRLLLRLYDPQRGLVRLGGQDLRTLALTRLRRELAIVNQDTYLFHGTVEDNLRPGKPEASQAELEAAARAANAHPFITRLPQGYRTVIGERGIRLSGGQRQRIAIARALLRDAPILVLDEALSSVDAENEAVISEALERLMEGRTTLIFAHRLSSVMAAHRILVLEAGRVVESGTHSQLMAKNGVYYRLMAAQALDSAEAPPHEALLFTDGAGQVGGAPGMSGETGEADPQEPDDDILRAEGLGWLGATVELLRMVAPWRGRLTLAFVLGVARVFALVGVGVLGALMVAAVQDGEPYSGYLIALGITAPLAGVFHWTESWIAHDMAFRLLAEMRIALFSKLDQLAPAYLLRRRSGDLVAMATQDVETVEFFFAHTVAPAFVSVLVPALVLAALAIYGWPMALALGPFLAVVALSPFLMRKRIDALGSRAREALGELNAHAVDTVQGLAEILGFQQAGRRGEEFAARIHRHHRLRLPFFSDLTLQMAVLDVATGMGGLAVIISGAWLAAAGSLDSGALPLLTLLAMAAFLPVSEIAHIGRQLADTLGSTRRLWAVHQQEVPVRDGPGVPADSKAKGVALEMEGVEFTYDRAKRPALQEATFTVPAGSTVALVGPSGAGKTTSAHLLMRFWDPQSGAVRLNGHDLRDYDLEALRREIALVTQDTYLFNDTLGANIRIAKPSAGEREIRAAVQRAALEEFVAALPDGLGTRVGERGVRLSGGQRQRVAIARAFLKDAPVLILDEATSHLDAVSEQLVRNALEHLMSERTTVVIAHRLSTVRNADKIVVLDEGRVVETGTHGELLNAGGLYAHLVARQLAGAHQERGASAAD
ncbi:MAG: ABC transporter ATP-binding protein [SAR324 cluster bacterium]|nr:ABC transporter ATP-binding protein [SAR324 cluster bacterium]